MLVYLGLIFPAIVLLFDFAAPVLDLLVPIMGRAGESSPADFVIGVVCVIFSAMLFLPIVPLLHQKPAFRTLFKLFSLIAVIGVAAAFFVNPYTPFRPKRVLIQHVTQTSPQVSSDVSNFVAYTSMDAIPLHKHVFDDMLRYFNKDLFPNTLSNTTASDWQALFPVDFLLGGNKVQSTFPVFTNGHNVKHPVLELLSDQFSPENNTRSVQIKITYPGSEWSTVRFAGQLVGWDINSPIPPPARSGYYHIRHVGGIGVDSWTLNLAFVGNGVVEKVAVVIQVVGSRSIDSAAATGTFVAN